MIHLLELLNKFHNRKIEYKDWEFYMDWLIADQRTAISSKFMRHLIEEDKIDISWYNSTYEFLLHTLSQWHLVKFLIPLMK